MITGAVRGGVVKALLMALDDSRLTGLWLILVQPPDQLRRMTVRMQCNAVTWTEIVFVTKLKEKMAKCKCQR